MLWVTGVVDIEVWCVVCGEGKVYHLSKGVHYESGWGPTTVQSTTWPVVCFC